MILGWFEGLKLEMSKWWRNLKQTNRQTEFQLVDSTPPVGGVEWKCSKYKFTFFVIWVMPDNVKFCRDGNLHHWNVKRNFSGAALWWNHKSSWQSIVKDMGQLVPFRASEGILAQKMVTLAATIALLQMMSILPTMGLCRTCKVPTPKWKEENWIFWECGSCPSASGKNIFWLKSLWISVNKESVHIPSPHSNQYFV